MSCIFVAVHMEVIVWKRKIPEIWILVSYLSFGGKISEMDAELKQAQIMLSYNVLTSNALQDVSMLK